MVADKMVPTKSYGQNGIGPTDKMVLDKMVGLWTEWYTNKMVRIKCYG